jgi:hypothetical protein
MRRHHAATERQRKVRQREQFDHKKTIRWRHDDSAPGIAPSQLFGVTKLVGKWK